MSALQYFQRLFSINITILKSLTKKCVQRIFYYYIKRINCFFTTHSPDGGIHWYILKHFDSQQSITVFITSEKGNFAFLTDQKEVKTWFMKVFFFSEILDILLSWYFVNVFCCHWKHLLISECTYILNLLDIFNN